MSIRDRQYAAGAEQLQKAKEEALIATRFAAAELANDRSSQSLVLRKKGRKRPGSSSLRAAAARGAGRGPPQAARELRHDGPAAGQRKQSARAAATRQQHGAHPQRAQHAGPAGRKHVGREQELQLLDARDAGQRAGGAADGGGAKTIRVKKDANSPAIAPTEENVISGRYPIWRYLYIYVNPALDRGEVGAYLKWIRSADGQKIVKNVGYYPLPKAMQLSSR